MPSIEIDEAAKAHLDIARSFARRNPMTYSQVIEFLFAYYSIKQAPDDYKGDAKE